MMSLWFASAANADRWTVTNTSAFPSVWFGANESGPDAPNLLRNDVLKYSAAWFGWQTLNGVNGCRNEEASLHSQTAAVKAAKPSMTTLAYGADVANVMTHYDLQKKALADKQNSGWWLNAAHTTAAKVAHSHREYLRASGGSCGFGGNPAYFAEVVIGQWASDPTVDAVFVDEADALVCTWDAARRDNGLPTLADVYAWSNGSVLAYRQAAGILAAKGKRLVVSLKNAYHGSAPVNAKIGHACAVQLDGIARGMAGVPWIRYHEYFAALSSLRPPPSSSKPNGTAMCHNTVRTAVAEAADPSMAFAVHGGDYGGGARTSLELTFTMFMIARNGTVGAARDWFSWSTGGFWHSRDWNWTSTEALYTRDWGWPKGAGARSGSVWSREYERGRFAVDCATLAVTITPG